MDVVSRSLSTELGVHAVLAASVAQTFSVRLPEPKEDRKAFAERFSQSRSKRGVKIHISKCQDVSIFIANVRRKKVGCNFVQFDALRFQNSFPTLNEINI